MDIVITKISDSAHGVRITREDGSQEEATLNSRSFLRHDLAHFAVETELPVKHGFWGLVASGASLAGTGFTGGDIAVAETLAGPVQKLLRTGADPARYLDLLQRVQPQLASADLAQRIHDRARSLLGQWKATPFGGSMKIAWDEQERSDSKRKVQR